MNDLSGFRPFRIDSFRGALGGGLPQTARELIVACQIKTAGYVEGSRAQSEGQVALATWLIAQGEALAAPAGHPLQHGSAIERIVAGEVVPEEAFALAIADMTQGAVLPGMFDRAADRSGDRAIEPTQDTMAGAGVPPLSSVPAMEASPSGKAPDPVATPVRISPMVPRAVPQTGALGGAVAAGRLFYPVADPRFADGFVLTGCGIALNLDASTAEAMRAAIDAGIAHLRAMKAGGSVAA